MIQEKSGKNFLGKIQRNNSGKAYGSGIDPIWIAAWEEARIHGQIPLMLTDAHGSGSDWDRSSIAKKTK